MLIMYVTMKLPFVSSREGQDWRKPEPEQIQNNTDISAMQVSYGPPVPGAILQLQMDPVPLRPNLTRPKERPEVTNPRPEAETVNIRPNADEQLQA